MGWLDAPMPHWLQWCGLLATFAGTALALWAALSAKGAQQQAREARNAAIRLGRVLQLSDLIDDLKELQSMLARSEFHSIAAKAAYLRGRVVRFASEAYNELRGTARAQVDIAREQLRTIAREAVNRRTLDETRVERIQIAFGSALESLNLVFAILRIDSLE